MARIASAMCLTLVLAVLPILDFLSTEYEAQATTLITLGALVVGLLGLEARDILRRD